MVRTFLLSLSVVLKLSDPVSALQEPYFTLFLLISISFFFYYLRHRCVAAYPPYGSILLQHRVLLLNKVKQSCSFNVIACLDIVTM